MASLAYFIAFLIALVALATPSPAENPDPLFARVRKPGRGKRWHPTPVRPPGNKPPIHKPTGHHKPPIKEDATLLNDVEPASKKGDPMLKHPPKDKRPGPPKNKPGHRRPFPPGRPKPYRPGPPKNKPPTPN